MALFTDRDVIRSGTGPHFIRREDDVWRLLRERREAEPEKVQDFTFLGDAIALCGHLNSARKPCREYIPGFIDKDGNHEALRVNFPQ